MAEALLIDFSLLTASSVLFDAVYVPGGAQSVAALVGDRDAVEFVLEAYRHCKPIAATGDGAELLRACRASSTAGRATAGTATRRTASSWRALRRPRWSRSSSKP
jgi:catalase